MTAQWQHMPRQPARLEACSQNRPQTLTLICAADLCALPCPAAAAAAAVVCVLYCLAAHSFASGVLTVSLSLKHRSSGVMNDADGQDDDDDLVTRLPSAVQHMGAQAHADSLRQHSSFTTAGSGESNSSSSSGVAVGHKQSRPVPACVSIPEEAQELGPNNTTSSAAAAAAVQTRSSLEHQQQQQPARPTGLLRVQSFTAHGR